MNYKDFGIAVLVYRKRNRIQQVPFAESAGISRNYLGMIEKGEATGLSLEVFINLSRAMDTDPCELLEILLEPPGESGER